VKVIPRSNTPTCWINHTPMRVPGTNALITHVDTLLIIKTPLTCYCTIFAARLQPSPPRAVSGWVFVCLSRSCIVSKRLKIRQ